MGLCSHPLLSRPETAIPLFRAPFTLLLAWALFGALPAGTAWADEGDIDLDAMDSAAALQADAIAAMRNRISIW